MIKNKIFALIASLLIAGYSSAQQATGPEVTAQVADQQVRQFTAIALANPSYPVTPGDRYVLEYSYRGELQTMSVTVSSDYQVDLGLFGIIPSNDLTYLELKKSVEEKANLYYPGSHPRLILENTGTFVVDVFLQGGVAISADSWGLTRLSDIIEDLNISDDYSIRRIRISQEGGLDSNYDFYRYLYLHDDSSNPLIRPGNRVNFTYSNLVVEVSGAVMEPGVKELVTRDSMDSIVMYFGGFKANADLEKIQKWQTVDGREEYSLYNWGDRELFNADSKQIRINVPLISDSRNIMAVEINTPPIIRDRTTFEEIRDEPVYGEFVRITVPVFEGMLISDVLREVEHIFNHTTELRYCTIIREGLESPIQVNLEDVRNDFRSTSNILILPNDVLGIPARNVFVTVSGGVYNPGRFFYTPMRDANYYITLAGGIDPTQNSHRNIVIYDQAGKERDSDELVLPGDNILVVQDNMVFQFNQKFATVTIALTFLITLTLLITSLATN